jgi:hypothetical protein
MRWQVLLLAALAGCAALVLYRGRRSLGSVEHHQRALCALERITAEAADGLEVEGPRWHLLVQKTEACDERLAAVRIVPPTTPCTQRRSRLVLPADRVPLPEPVAAPAPPVLAGNVRVLPPLLTADPPGGHGAPAKSSTQPGEPNGEPAQASLGYTTTAAWRPSLPARRHLVVAVAATMILIVGLVLGTSDEETDGPVGAAADAMPTSRAAGLPERDTPGPGEAAAPPQPMAEDTETPGAPFEVVATDDDTVTIYLPAGPVGVRLLATGPCWVEIRDGDNRRPARLAELLAAGDERRAVLDLPARVRLGNPGVLSLMVMGHPIPLPAVGPINVMLSERDA